ncbi:transcriptional regulator [Saccharomonospora marina XMU15]|uniref:Transcriptional regulator n=1 Tax=Saccharomonospora marina XMU15 TaxID=882083 RepID=H5WWP8_9PSEU|nr:TetR/AcrR family transcriptional regulator [Saccharomonospora marina]EHR51661.1 transcriptional regulator [Saccharomonospora marina XMU15]
MPDRVYAGRSAADRRAERRRRLLRAGLALFGTQGYAATSIEKLCAAAGVSTRNFYEEFTGREELLLALHDGAQQRAMSAVSTALARAGEEPLARRIELAVSAYLTATATDPRWARLSAVEVVGVSATVERHRLAWRSRWAEFLAAEARREAACGRTRDRDFDLTAVALTGAVDELLRHWAAGERQVELDDVVAELVRIATAALADSA